MKSKILLISVIVLAFLLRVIGLSNYPSGFTQDEAAIGYEAYSILSTGKDSWGQQLPLMLRSFGDFKLPLYSYLAIPFVAVFGLNVFSVRLVSAIFGTLAVFSTYLLTRELSKRKSIALWAALLMAISPWSVSLSRGAFEANLTTFILPFATWLYLKGINNSKYYYLSFLLFGFNLFSYHSARIFTIMFVPIILYLTIRTHLIGNKSKYNLRKIIAPSLTFAVFFLIALQTMFYGGSKRGLDVSIFNPTDKWSYVSERRYEAVLSGVPDSLARIFSNKMVYIFSKSFKSYLSYLSPNFLFTDGAGEWTYGMISGRGVLYTIEAVSVVAALIYLIKGHEKYKYLRFILIWILLSPIAVSISKNVGYAANRVTVMMPAIQILSTSGFVIIAELAKSYFKVISSKAYQFLILGVIALSFIFFVEDYFIHAPYKQGRDMHYGVSQVMQFVMDQGNDYDKIYISRSLSVPNIWVEFFHKVNPVTVQQESANWLEYERQDKLYLDQLESYSLGKYIFTSIDIEKIRTQKELSLIIAKPEDFHKTPFALLTVYYRNSDVAYYVVDSQSL